MEQFDVAVIGAGPAAGAAAAVAVKNSVKPDALDAAEVRHTLQRHGAVLPDRFRA